MRPVALINARPLDVATGEFRDGAVITDESGRIAGITDDPAAIAPDLDTIDLGGRHVLPGLIDAHVHLSFPTSADLPAEINRELPAYLAIRAVGAARATLDAGVTTVRDGASTSYIDIALKKAIERGHILGPRVMAAGYALRMTGGHGDSPTSTLLTVHQPGRVDGVDGVRHAARLNIKMGADHLKIFASGGLATPNTEPGLPQFTLEEMAAAVDVAHTAGYTVMAHSYGAEACKRAILAGVDSIEHGCLIDDEGLAMMRDHGTYLVPTLTPFWRGHDRVTDAADDPRSVRSAEMYGKAVDTLGRATATGVRIAMGTDTGTAHNPHGQNAREISLMVSAGLSPIEAIRAATIDCADLLGRSDVGSLTQGRYADLIAVTDNPLEHPDLFEDPANVVFVMKGGQVIRDGGER